jgi:hypothetical protein
MLQTLTSGDGWVDTLAGRIHGYTSLPVFLSCAIVNAVLLSDRQGNKRPPPLRLPCVTCERLPEGRWDRLLPVETVVSVTCGGGLLVTGRLGKEGRGALRNCGPLLRWGRLIYYNIARLIDRLYGYANS